VEWSKEEGIIGIQNHLCRLANDFIESEVFDPKRMLTTSMPVDHGNWPLVSVKSDPPLPKAMMLEVMDEIIGKRVPAPIQIGDVLVENVRDTGCNIIATRNIKLQN
jgi:CxxC motif-containing protein